jgi:hypothetical protein
MNKNEIINRLNLANEKLSKLDLIINNRSENKIENLDVVNNKVRRIYKSLSLANKTLSKLENYEVGYTENRTVWFPILRSDQYPIVTTKVRLADLPNIPSSKISNLYPITYIYGGNIDS